MIQKLLLLFVLISLSSCKSDDDSCVVNETNPLSGTWNLVSISCECEPVFLGKGAHQWTFDMEKSEVIITNQVQNSSDLLLASDTYPAVFEEDMITIEGTTYDYYFENVKLFLANLPEADGPLITFVK